MKKKGRVIQMRQTEIFAHRGASHYAPENTIEAFSLAKEQGADGVELDVQLTKDGQVVVIHDETIDRVSDGSGFVKDHTLEELKTFSFHNHMEQFRGAKIPTLKEVLELLKPFGMKVNIELKTGIYWYPGIEEKTLKIVQDCGMESRVIYSSFNHYSIQRVRELKPEAETAYLFGDVMLQVEEYAKKTGVKGLHPALYHVKMAEFLREYLESGLAVRVWTVNEPEDMKLLMDAGVTALITNKPDVARQVFG
ncbi:glycerophosphoryl diester phosphodiesterase [Hespellia stercorisuis DSM 15480]|uniref:Glycerophosphoryl diester phosphodiesterase n=2 Tax=Hespellia stercorisuis TaxID=180311 RepID=A0A1M6U0K1_9FIRM|nr:glycerophosphoryl diester phosphodiesterase [Hespellia stercorisuis DSM 15480]